MRKLVASPGVNRKSRNSSYENLPAFAPEDESASVRVSLRFWSGETS